MCQKRKVMRIGPGFTPLTALQNAFKMAGCAKFGLMPGGSLVYIGNHNPDVRRRALRRLRSNAVSKASRRRNRCSRA